MSSVLVTGASGFVGKRVCFALSRLNYQVRNVYNTSKQSSLIDSYICFVDRFDGETNWLESLQGIESVVHLAARTHLGRKVNRHALAELRTINVDSTLNLARQAAESGVRRFIFISSIKVNGETTTMRPPFVESDEPRPNDYYARSKFEAEQGIMEIALRTGMEVVIIRPPLVYGPGVKANLFRLLQWVDMGLPLPFGAIENRRSLVYVDNLVDLIIHCLGHPQAVNRVCLVSDGKDLSTTQLLRMMAAALERTSCLIPVPQNMLESGLKMIGKGDLAQRLCGSLQVDTQGTQKLLNWKPPFNIEYGLKQTALWFQELKTGARKDI